MKLYKTKGIELISNLALSNSKMPGVIKYIPSKTEILQEEKPTLKRCAPERMGVSSTLLSKMLDEIAREERTNIHSITVVKDSHVILEAMQTGYGTLQPHVSHSMSKTVTAMLIGILFDEGKLTPSDTLGDIFTEYDVHPKTALITIDNLLKMSSAIPFSEIGAVTESRWTETFLSEEPTFTPGEKFAYNSMNSYILMVIAARIISEQYGISVSEFIDARIFSPLKIKSFFWEKGPEGIEKGGWGLYLSGESWAKLGIMMLSGGVYEGKRILSEAFVATATSTHITTPQETGSFNYGYHVWVSREGQNFLFNGMLGQNLLAIPKNNIVISINSGGNELFQESPALSIIEKYLSIDTEALIQPANSKISLPKAIEAFSSHRMTLKPKKKQRGIMELLGLRSDTPFDSELSPLLKCFDFAENNQGILPLFVRVLQNNYQGSIKKFRFVRERNSLYLISREGEKEYSYEIGIYGYKFTELEYEKEKYTVGALVSYMGKENGKRKYRIEFIFPELANKRSIELILDEKDRLQVKMSEFPDSKIAGTFISSIPAMNPKIGFAISLLESNLGKNFIEKRLSELFSPTLFAIYENSEEREAFLSRENERINEKLASMGMVKMMINSFFGRENEENTPQKPSSLGGLLFSAMLGGLFSKKKEQTEITNE